MASGGCDHSLYAWTVLPLVLSARRFDDIEKMLPIQNGLSENGLASSVCIVNLVMLLFYREPAWEKPVLVSAKKVLQKTLHVGGKGGDRLSPGSCRWGLGSLFVLPE